jgi:hypothetical protein
VYPAALAVGRGAVDRGIFLDGVGYGSALIANRIHSNAGPGQPWFAGVLCGNSVAMIVQPVPS